MNPTSTGRALALLLLAPSALLCQTKPAGQTKEAEAEFIKSAEAGAPARISEKAAVARIEPKGQVTMIRPGSNGFTCALFPDETHAPICADRSGFRWFVAAMSQQPKPPTTGGVAYMAKGGVHYETPDGKSVMMPTGSTKEVREPPHWMLLTPMDPTATGIPTRPNAGGTYIMFAGTPYAHLMFYQDPKMLKD
jgi:hypothetical protein